MIQTHLIGYVKDLLENGIAVIYAAVPNIQQALLRKSTKVWIILWDGRRITPEQRRKIYALLGEITEYVDGERTSEGVEEQKRFLKLEFMLKRMEAAERKIFSLSDCDVTTAREFCDFLIEFIVANDVPTKIPLIENCDDIGKYIYACLMNRKCAVCGKSADVHHCEDSRVGAGSDRNEVHHLGREVLPLCRVHHTECHGMSEAEFIEKYHLQKVRLDEQLCRRLKLRK